MGEDGTRQEKPGRHYNQTQLCGCRGRAGVEGKVIGGQGGGGEGEERGEAPVQK